MKYPNGKKPQEGEEFFIIEIPAEKDAAGPLVGGVPIGLPPQHAQVVGTVSFRTSQKYANVRAWAKDRVNHRDAWYNWNGLGDMYAWSVERVQRFPVPMAITSRVMDNRDTSYRTPWTFTDTQPFPSLSSSGASLQRHNLAPKVDMAVKLIQLRNYVAATVWDLACEEPVDLRRIVADRMRMSPEDHSFYNFLYLWSIARRAVHRCPGYHAPRTLKAALIPESSAVTLPIPSRGFPGVSKSESVSAARSGSRTPRRRRLRRCTETTGLYP